MKNNKPLVTIGIPTYNRANAFLPDAIKCVVGQTYENIEIIISDNCSSDDTQGLVESFNNSRIRYYRHPKNIGAINNFNFCVDQAKGEYFLLLHDDDLIDSDMVEVCISELGGDRPGVIIAGTRLVDGKGSILAENANNADNCTLKEFFLGWFASKTVLYLCSTLYHTERLRKMGGFHSKTNHFLDVVATMKLAALYGRVDVPHVKASFRRHEDNMGGNPSKIDAWSEDSIYLLNTMCELLENNNDKELLRKTGVPFLASKSYRLADSIRSPIGQLRAYRRTYKLFGYKYSPLQFWGKKYILAYLKSGVRKIRHFSQMGATR